MKTKQIQLWLLLLCFLLSCAVCIWAWMFAIYRLFLGMTALPALFLQALIRRVGTEWKWLLIVHGIILLCSAGTGGLIILLSQNMAQMYGILLAVVAGFALVGCLLELVIHLIFCRKDERDEEQS